MIVFDSIDDILIPPSASPLHLAVGVFDGVHLAHAALLGALREEAAASGGAAAAFTFRNHPRSVVQPDNAPRGLLTPWPVKRRLLEHLGLDYVVAVDFTPELAATAPEDFVAEVLLGRCRANAIYSGKNFRFGKNGKGGPELLKELASQHGFHYQRIEPVKIDGERVSSTLIRGKLEAGLTKEAMKLLGRPHQIEGVIVTGDGLGKEIGFPTANLQTTDQFLLPADGVYAVAVYIDDDQSALQGMMNIGWRPTIGGTQHRLEVHVLNFDEALVGKSLTVQFIDRLRGEVRFPDMGELKTQLKRDKQNAEALLSGRDYLRY